LPAKPFSLLVKPASADCNLRCEYCFYLDKAGLYPETTVHRMSDAVLERMVASYMATPQPTYAFGWQGGEPTLMGTDFFRRITDLQQRHGHPGASVANGVQTNATLIDDAMAEHFAQFHFLLGVSLDGPAELHDRQRLTQSGGGTHAAVWRGIETLRRHQVEFNILTLVSQANVAHPREVYRYLRDHGFLYHQYIPCFEADGAGNPLPFAIDGEAWGEFLCAIFDEWMQGDTRRVSIRLFDSILALLIDGIRNVCHFGNDCRQYFVVEFNGDIYPCDFFVEKDLRLGNILDSEWSTLDHSDAYRDFGQMKAQWHEACGRCPWLSICAGDCLKHRRIGPGRDPRSLSRLCAGWQRFYAHALPDLRTLAETIRRDREAQHRQMFGQRAQGAPPGRNHPCPCGSGKKYKKCCGG
jgi:uncharacterized protein